MYQWASVRRNYSWLVQLLLIVRQRRVGHARKNGLDLLKVNDDIEIGLVFEKSQWA